MINPNRKMKDTFLVADIVAEIFAFRKKRKHLDFLKNEYTALQLLIAGMKENGLRRKSGCGL